MKSTHKYLFGMALSGIICLALALPASAQHDHQSNSGAGGGGGGSRPAPSSAPAARSFSAPAPARSYSSPRPSYSNTRPSYSNTARTNNNQVQRNFNYNQRSSFQGSVNATGRTYSGHPNTNVRVGVTAQPYHFQGGNTYMHNRGYLPGNGLYHYNRGNYRSHYAPRLGFSVGFLPYGYYPFYFGDYQYYYSDGLFYQYNNDEYTVVEPPVGAEITTLPSNAQSIVINGQQYYEADGVYYKPITKDDGTLSYEVAGKDGELNTNNDGQDDTPAAPQIGDIVNQLPPNSKKMSINGQRLYVSPDGIYYQAQVDQNNNTTYKIVGLPEDNGQDQGQQ